MFKNKKILLLISFAILSYIFSFFKISFLFGNEKCFFSGISFILPLIGAFFNLYVSVFFIGLFFLIKFFTFKILLTFGLPTLISAICFNVSLRSEKSKLVKFSEFSLKVLLPLFCIFLFVINPIGNGAFLYSFYWFIPVILYFVGKNNIFSTALTSTFLAHGVGSVIWLYAVGMTSAQWLSLIPVVAFERLVFTCGLTLSYLAFKKVLALKMAKNAKLAIFKN